MNTHGGTQVSFRSKNLPCDRLPVITNGFDVNDPAQWSFINGVSEIRLRPQYADNTIDNGQIGFNWQLTDALRLKGGGQYKEYTFSSREERRSSELVVPSLPAGVTLADLTKRIGLEGISGGAIGDIDWRISGSTVTGKLVEHGKELGIFTGTISSTGVSGQITMHDGRSGLWSWDGPLPSAAPVDGGGQ